MNLIELTSTKTALRKYLHELERITPSCHSCEHFAQGQCAQAQAAPPPEWVKGPVECERWEHDGIPF